MAKYKQLTEKDQSIVWVIVSLILLCLGILEYLSIGHINHTNNIQRVTGTIQSYSCDNTSSKQWWKSVWIQVKDQNDLVRNFTFYKNFLNRSEACSVLSRTISNSKNVEMLVSNHEVAELKIGGIYIFGSENIAKSNNNRFFITMILVLISAFTGFYGYIKAVKNAHKCNLSDLKCIKKASHPVFTNTSFTLYFCSVCNRLYKFIEEPDADKFDVKRLEYSKIAINDAVKIFKLTESEVKKLSK